MTQLIGNVYRIINDVKNLNKTSNFTITKFMLIHKIPATKSVTMCSKDVSKPSEQNAIAQIKQNIPVQLTDLSIFDNSYAFMKERFNQEMKRIDQEMHKFSLDLKQAYGGTSTVHTGFVPPNWAVLQNSPLVIGEGEDKTLKLQFDVSQFDPSEIKVKLLNDMLIISATHEEKTKDTTVYREYNRQFKLPPGTDSEQVVSTLSRDGVLTVQAPLPLPDSSINSITEPEE